MMRKEDIQKLRKETDGVSKVIHLNNAGASLPPNVVKEAVFNYLEEEMTYGGYETHTRLFDEYEKVYDAVAKLLNADRTEIAIMENATVGWRSAFLAIDWQDGDIVLTTKADYASNYLSYLHLQRKIAIKIEVIPNDSFGQPDVIALKTMLSDKVKLVSVTHMPTNSGLVADVEAIGEVVRSHSAYYLIDACQTAGQYPIDVEKIGCDMLSATGRKYLRAPRGTGFLYVSGKIMHLLTPDSLDLHSADWTGKNEYTIRADAKKFENWEGNRAGVMGLKAAVDYINAIGIDEIWERVQYLGNYARQEMAKIEKVTLRDIGKVKGGIVSFTVEGKTCEEVKNFLFSKGININWNGLSNTFLDMDARGLKEIARASVHYYNTEEEIDVLCEKLKELD
jgi:cysteine desulfurase / selenocysteine lyase